MTARAITFALVAAGSMTLLLAGGSAAQIGGAYDLSWNRIAGGGVAASGGIYSLSGTSGQPEAGFHSGGSYALRAGFWNGGATPVGIELPPVSIDPVLAFRLFPARPSPFVTQTTIAFDLPRAAPARLDAFNAAGERVETLVDGDLGAGRHEIVWRDTRTDGRRLAQGLYLLRLEAGENVATGKVIVAK
jgi:FlgD Ig-like domain